MATKTKKSAGDYTFKHNDVPNSLDHREKTRKANACQLCGVKVPLKDQFTVVNDLENGTVKKQKNAARKGAEKLSHYCGPDKNDCAGKRVKQKEAWLKTREDSPAPKPKKSSAKKSSAKPKSAKKSKAKPKAKAAASSTKEVDPF